MINRETMPWIIGAMLVLLTDLGAGWRYPRKTHYPKTTAA